MSETMRRSKPRANKKIEANMRGLLADLALLDMLQGIKVEIAELDNRVLFYESVHGRTSKLYRNACNERDGALLRADSLIQRWVERRTSDVAISA